MPERIQRKRTREWRMPEGAVYVGRPTRYGNPFNDTQVGTVFELWGFPMPIVKLHTDPGRERCIDLYTAWLKGVLTVDPTFLDPLMGKDLCCWCRLDELCHADVILRILPEQGSDQQTDEKGRPMTYWGGRDCG